MFHYFTSNLRFQDADERSLFEIIVRFAHVSSLPCRKTRNDEQTSRESEDTVKDYDAVGGNGTGKEERVAFQAWILANTD